MAATCLDTVTSALKLAKVLPSGGTPSAEETADGMRCLQSLYDGLVTGGMFGQLEDVYLDADDTAEEGKRYYIPAGITLTAPTSEYVDASGETRQPRDLALYESLTSTGTRSVMLYDRTAWVPLLDLASTDTAPLSNRGAMGLAACLATSEAFVGMFGDDFGTATPILATKFIKNIMGKFGSTQDSPAGTYY